MKKIVVAQQIFRPTEASGPTTEFNILTSKLSTEFEIVPVIYNGVHKGFDGAAISFYFKEFKKINPDIVVIRGASIDSFYAVLGAKKAKCKCVITGIHGLYSDSKKYNVIKKAISKYIIERTVIKKSDYFYTVANRCYKEHGWMKKYSKKYIGTIHNPYPDILNEEKKYLRSKTRKELNIPKELPIGLFVGRITEDKGVIELSNAILKAQSEVKFGFIFVGNGDSEGKCKEILKTLIEDDKVFFVGAKKSVKEYYSASDFFVFPSKHENHPFSILEACAFGKYCLASDVGDIFETIIEGLNGEKLKDSDAATIKEAIVNLIKTKKYKIDFCEEWTAAKKDELSLGNFVDRTRKMYIKCYEETK